MVATPIVVNSRGLEDAARPEGRRLTRAVGIAIGVVALGAFAAIIVGLYENQSLISAAGPSARAPLPADLFAPPRAPKPRIVVRYAAPRSTPPASAASAPAMASPTSSGYHRPSPSPSPRGGDD